MSDEQEPDFGPGPEEYLEKRPAQGLERQGFERQSPHSMEAERVVLGAVFLDNALMSLIVELLIADHFYSARHRHIFAVMCFLFENGSEISSVLVSEELKRQGHLESAGGADYVNGLPIGIMPSVNIEHYAKLVIGKFSLRSLIKVSMLNVNRAFEEEDPPEVILEQAESDVFHLTLEHTQDGFTRAGVLAHTQVAKAHEMQNMGVAVTGLGTGYADLDSKTLGWQRDDLIICAARPSMGKTAFALMLAQNAGLRMGANVGIFSLEMSKEALINRMLCSEGGIDSQRFRNGFLSTAEWDRIHQIEEEIQHARIWINDTPAISTLGIRAKTRRLISEQGQLDLLIVDYLQLMSGGSGGSGVAGTYNPRRRAENRQQEISQISRELKAMAKELHVPLIALSQLSRAPENRTDHRPQLSDLRESGAIEQDADVVVFLYREDYYKHAADHTATLTKTAEILLGKQRNGPTGLGAMLRFEETTGRFDNLYEDDATN